VIYQIGRELVEEEYTLDFFLGDNRPGHTSLLIFLSGSKPVSVELVFTAVVIRGPKPYGPRLQPRRAAHQSPPRSVRRLCEDCVPDAGSAQRRLLQEGSTASARCFHLKGIILPRSCPHGGWPVASQFSFQDGSTVMAKRAVPCSEEVTPPGVRAGGRRPRPGAPARTVDRLAGHTVGRRAGELLPGVVAGRLGACRSQRERATRPSFPTRWERGRRSRSRSGWGPAKKGCRRRSRRIVMHLPAGLGIDLRGVRTCTVRGACCAWARGAVLPGSLIGHGHAVLAVHAGSPRSPSRRSSRRSAGPIEEGARSSRCLGAAIRRCRSRRSARACCRRTARHTGSG